MKQILLLLVCTLPFLSYSQSCPDVTASATMNYNGSFNDTIRACYGDTIYLKDNGSTDNMASTLVFFQFYVNGQQIGALSAQNDSIPYVVENQGITEIQYFVTNQDECVSAYYPLFIISHQPEVDFLSSYSSCVGDSLHLSFAPTTQDTAYHFSRIETNMLECMADNNSQTFTLNVSGVSPATITQVSDINFIRIAMEHNRIGELEIEVTCPGNQTVTLMTAGTGQFEDFGDPIWGNQSPAVDCNDFTTVGTHYNYDFGGPNAWGTIADYVQFVGGNIPGGDYDPDNDYSGFVGCPVNGTWTLTITDDQLDNDGSIGNWGIDFNGQSIDIGVSSIDYIYDPNAANSFWSTSDNYTYLSSDLDTLYYSNAAAGSNIYSYHLIDNNGCESSWDVEYTLNNAPAIYAGADGTFCEGVNLNGYVGAVTTDCEVELHMYDDFGDGWNGSTLEIDIAGNVSSFTGVGPNNIETFMVPSGSDIYLTFNNSTSWPEECSYYVIVSGDTLFSEGLGGTIPAANNVMLTIDCAGANTYWTPNDGSLSDVNDLNATVNSIGNLQYVLHYDDPNNPTCQVTDTVNLIVNENPEIQDTVFSGCFGNYPSVDPNPSGGATPYTENWYGEDPMNLFTGQYLYTVTDANGCSDSKVIDINFSDSMYFSNVQVTDATCFGEANGAIYFLFNGGVSPINFDWGGVNFNQIPAGTHQLIAIDSLGCRDTLDYSVTEPAEILISGTVTDVQSQDDGAVDISVSGGTGSTYTYLWNNGETTEDVSGLPGGDFIVTVTDSIGCTEVDTFTVVDPFVGLDENGKEQFLLYPNPTNGMVNIQMSSTFSEGLMEVRDSKGALLLKRDLKGSQLQQFDLSGFDVGVYHVRISGRDFNETLRIVKK